MAVPRGQRDALALAGVAPSVSNPVSVTSERLDWTEAHEEYLRIAASWIGEGLEYERVDLAQAACSHAIRAFWRERAAGEPFEGWCSADVPFALRSAATLLVQSLGGASLLEASYHLGSLYTRLLPEGVRSELGAFYTPPQLAERLLDLAAAEGADWATATVLDPACGGGAFLLPVAHRMLSDHRIRKLESRDQLCHLEGHLFGIEIDEFAAWMTRTLLRLLVLPLQLASGYEPRFAIEEADAIERVLDSDESFDLVVGNPPFRRITLSAERRAAFGRSLFGHANTYGLFLDAALRWRDAEGLVAFLTPTSFLGGQYFSRLRDLIVTEAPPLVIDIVEARRGVFPSVLQETCLAVFGPNPERSTVVHHLSLGEHGVLARRAGMFRQGDNSGAPWLLPRSRAQAEIVAKSARSQMRLHDLGFKASTGPLVWNRHKTQLRKQVCDGALPLIWAEAVRPNRFSFQYLSRSHAPYVKVLDGQEHLVTRDPCVLVQRTTAKEQPRRIVACAVPEDFIGRWSGMVVENHVNVLRPLGKDSVSPRALAAVLNTTAIDLLFRSISGSVAVSATELHSIPLPDPDFFAKVDALLAAGGADGDLDVIVEEAVARWYGVGLPGAAA